MTDLPAILFPHSYITGPGLKKTLVLLARLTICQPWFMEAPLQAAEKEGLSLVHVLHPPVSQKPKGNFKGLLSEYQLWIRQNQDKGYAAFLRATRETAPSEDTPWEIRQMMRRMGEDSSIHLDDHALKWHLILHLAREFEENRVAAEEMLNQLKQQKSPLEEALGEGATLKTLFEDLPQSETYPFINEHNIRQVLEAWLGLFGQYLPSHGLLITFDRHVMAYATEILEQAPSGNAESGILPTVELDLPDLSHLHIEELLRIKQQHLDGSLTEALRILIKNLEDQAGPRRDELSRLSVEAAKALSPELTSAQIHITLKNLPGPSDKRNAQRHPVLEGLSGKTIVLLED